MVNPIAYWKMKNRDDDAQAVHRALSAEDCRREPCAWGLLLLLCNRFSPPSRISHLLQIRISPCLFFLQIPRPCIMQTFSSDTSAQHHHRPVLAFCCKIEQRVAQWSQLSRGNQMRQDRPSYIMPTSEFRSNKQHILISSSHDLASRTSWQIPDLILLPLHYNRSSISGMLLSRG